jgi:hypothetical protein
MYLAGNHPHHTAHVLEYYRMGQRELLQVVPENEGSVSETLINTANRSTELTASDSTIRRSPAGSQQQDWSAAAAVAAVAG